MRRLSWITVCWMLLGSGSVFVAALRAQTSSSQPAVNGGENVPPAAPTLVGKQTLGGKQTLVGKPTLVGKQVCRECHAENYHLHAQSGHASTFAKAAESELAEKFVNQSLDAGIPYGVFHYAREDGELRVRREGDETSDSLPLQYVFGSGRNAITLLTLVEQGENSSEQGKDSVEQGADSTVGVEHRVSWFGAHGGFGLTPGHANKTPHTELEFFGDVVRGESLNECVRCHTTAGKIEGSDVVDLVASVNCERCHGPGSEHVRQARLSNTPPPYSVGKATWDLESELQLCGSCHRMPRHIETKELRDYSARMLRFQPVGMLRSECYLESQGNFMCSTCHDPHADSKSKSKEAYVNDCRKCHSTELEHHVVCPVSPEDGCIECHMPAVTFEQGMVFHDHWIRVRDDL